MSAHYRNAGGVDWGEGGFREGAPSLVRPPDLGHVATLRVGREIVDVAVAAGREHDRVAHVRTHPAAHEVAHDDAPRSTLDHDQVEHFAARVHRDLAEADLAGQRLVGPEQELLAGLAA